MVVLPLALILSTASASSAKSQRVGIRGGIGHRTFQNRANVTGQAIPEFLVDHHGVGLVRVVQGHDVFCTS